MSKEHVWPEWLDELLPPGVAEAGHNYAFEDAERGEYRRLEGMPPHDVKVRDVCEPCNHGWMNQAEEVARPIIARMVGGSTELHAIEQAKLAFWGVMKGLVAVRVGGDSGAAGLPLADDYREVYASRQSRMPPEGFLVHIARAAWSARRAPAGFFRLTGIHREGREQGDEFDGYAITFTALDVVVHVIRVPGIKPHGLVPFDDPRFGRAIRRIWPIQPNGVDWPPDDALTWAGLEAMSGGKMKP
jgi:hypothetical protein